MRAVLLREGRASLVDCPAPRPAAGEAVIRVELAGICGTDLEIARGYLDFEGIPGHEFVGVVEQTDEPGWTGKRVVGEINVACGRCKFCRAGLGRHCPQRTVLGIAGRDGAFAERLCLPRANLHEVPETVPDEVAVFAEPLAAAYEITEQIEIAPGTRLLVLGDGRLGQLCALVLARAGAVTTVCGRHPEKLRRLEARGLRTLPADARVEREFDVVVEATGAPEGLRRAFDVVHPRGTVVLKSTYHGEAPFALAGVVIDEITVVGSRCGPFPPALRHLASDPSIVEGMITDRFSLDDARAAFERAAQPDALKVVLVP